MAYLDETPTIAHKDRYIALGEKRWQLSLPIKRTRKDASGNELVECAHIKGVLDLTDLTAAQVYRFALYHLCANSLKRWFWSFEPDENGVIDIGDTPASDALDQAAASSSGRVYDPKAALSNAYERLSDQAKIDAGKEVVKAMGLDPEAFDDAKLFALGETMVSKLSKA